MADKKPDNVKEAEKGALSAAEAKKQGSQDPVVAHGSEHDTVTSHGVRPDQLTVKDASEAYYGHFATVEGGPHKGSYGVYEDTLTSDENGRPLTVAVRTRDDNHQRIVVKYDDLARAEAGGRR